MKQTPGYTCSQRIFGVFISALMILGVVLAALPQPAQAASCQAYHTVKKGDKTGTIANTYGVKWVEIAAANNLQKPYQLVEGQHLCIPFRLSVSLKNKLAVQSINNLIKITTSNFQNGGNYYVKVRDVTSGAGEWFKIGKMRVSTSQKVTSRFILPGDLKSAIYLQVCLKNGTNNDLFCQTVRHVVK